MASVAPEMALEELQNRLSAESQTSWTLAEPLSLEEEPEPPSAVTHPTTSSPEPGSLEAIPPPLRQPRRAPARGHEQHGKWAAAGTNASPHQAPSAEPPQEEDLASASITSHPPLASGEKAKAKDILDAIRTLKHLEHEGRQANPDERQALMRFGGFGPVALSLFPDPVTGSYKDPAWQALGETLRMLLSPEEYESAERTTFNAFYTSPTVIRAMHEALGRLGVPREAIVLEPGCGTGNFMALAPQAAIFWGLLIFSERGFGDRCTNLWGDGHASHAEWLDMFSRSRCVTPSASSMICSPIVLLRTVRRSSLLDTSLASISPTEPSGSPALLNPSRPSRCAVGSLALSPSTLPGKMHPWMSNKLWRYFQVKMV